MNGPGSRSKLLRETRGARRSAHLPRFHQEPRAFPGSPSLPGASSSPWTVRLQETEAARRMTPPRSQARLRLRILAAARTSGRQGIPHHWFETQSPTRSAGSPSPKPSSTELSQGRICFSETGAPGRTCGRPRPREATPPSSVLRWPHPGPSGSAPPASSSDSWPASTWLPESPTGGAGPVRWLHWNANDRKVGTQGS